MDQYNDDIEKMEEGQLDAHMPTDYELLELRRAINRERLAIPDVDKEWSKWKESVYEKEQQEIAEEKSSRSSVMITRMKYFLAAAAAVALLLVVRGLWQNESPSPNEVFTANPDSKDVVFSTDGGEMNVVKDKTLAFTPSPTTDKKGVAEQKIKTVTLSTPRGKGFQVTLPDGTKVWLNADSKIEFPERFTGKERHVSVSGEVYMEVAHDVAHPFVVTTDYFTTTVLGTIFNLRAYSNRDASLTLIDGSVRCKTLKGQELTLVPNQQAVFNTNNSTFNVLEVDTYPITQWKEGFFYFNNVSLLTIMQELGRWYNVSVVFENPEDMRHLLHFVAEHNEPISKILKRINDLDIVKVSFDKGVVTIH